MVLVHAAVIAINEAIDHQESVATLEAMKNPAALLVNIKDCLKCSYQQAMFRAKQSKAEVVQNKVCIQQLPPCLMNSISNSERKHPSPQYGPIKKKKKLGLLILVCDFKAHWF